MDMTQSDKATPSLPSYLRETEPLELEDVPLQVALLTMEVAALRQKMEQAGIALPLKIIITDD
jgi:hypothetical protein